MEYAECILGLAAVVRSVLVGFDSKLVKFTVRFHYSNDDEFPFDIDLENSTTAQDVLRLSREART